MTHGEQTHFWHNCELGVSFEALTATYITHSFARHTHEGFAIGVIERGAETFYYRGQTHVARAGSVVVINPGELHTGQAVRLEDGWTYRMIYPAAELVQRAAAEVAGTHQDIPLFDEPVIYDPAVFERLRLAHLALEQSASAVERETRLLAALTLLIQRHAAPPPVLHPANSDHAALHRAQAYLQEHFAENLSLETLARAANLSPFHLCRLFRDQIGLPPHAYLNQVRVNRAKSLLKPGLPIADVALATGFVDQSHLSRAFKRIVGVAPGQYRKILQDT